jgi:hypothetical protein
MGIQDRLAQMVNRGTAYFSDGYTVQLQKRNTLTGSRLVDGGGTPGLVTSEMSAGVSSLSFTSAVTLTGVLFSGSTLTIAGDSTSYTTIGDATPSGTSLTVTVSPVLQISTASGLVVTTSSPAPYTFSALSGNLKEEDLSTLELVRPRKIYLATEGSTVTPAVNDTIIDDEGADPIQVLLPLAPGSGQVGWSTIVGGKK